MKKELNFFLSSKTAEGNKLCIKALGIVLFLFASMVFVNASENLVMVDINESDGIGNYSLAFEQQAVKTITGTVTDSDGNALPGVNVRVKGTTTGTITNSDGKYSIQVESEEDILVFSFVGMTTVEIPVADKTEISVTLQGSSELLDDVVVVGYGVQTKESVVGSITRTTGDELQQAGGVTNVGEALQGRLPGVTTIISSGMPGKDDYEIYIRGQSSWNGSGQPLILVDGVERSMSDIDLNEIEQISVLKDASATAVFGVKGANGVILITTKRGVIGKAKLTLSANTTIKLVSKLPEKLNSYDAILLGNESIMRELMYVPGSWNRYRPLAIAEKYRNPASIEESYIYPDVDWAEEVLKDYATDARVNLSVRGGSEFAQYFASLAYQSVSDIFNGNKHPNGKGYNGDFSYERFNYRSNLDFKITSTTKFSVNLSGFLGIREEPDDNISLVVNPVYSLSPSIYTPVYPDGYYGADISFDHSFTNPFVVLNNTGYEKYNEVQMNSDFILDQELDFITKGLSFKGKLSYDNVLTSVQGLDDPADYSPNLENVFYRVYEDGEELIFSNPGINDFGFVIQPWDLSGMDVQDNSRMRRLNYELSLNYKRTFGTRHNVTALFLLKREEFARGNMFPRFREDWVGRLTYNYYSRYFVEINGAYNGSEKFGPGYRFDLFPSAGVGWMVSNESFMSGLLWLDKLKIRGSYGLIGDDNFPGRWKYITQWSSGDYALLDPTDFTNRSPYLWYREESVGNPDLQWETAIKSNIGAEVSLWENMITADFDYFMEDRDNILISGSQRSVPDFYGTDPPDANSGQVEVRGYELVVGFNYRFNNGIRAWANYSLTDAKDKVIYKEDPALRPFYLKAEGYAIGQMRSAIPANLMTSWDDIYMSTPTSSDQEYRRIGYYDLVDFNADGNYNSTYDNAPYGYPTRPEKTWNMTLGAGYKSFNFMVQFYGTQNATKRYVTRSFNAETDIFFTHKLGYWSKENPEGTTTLPEWSLSQGADEPYAVFYDASILRLKTIEISYDIPDKICNKMGISAMKLFVNGNNLYLWTTLPDDREFNGDGNLAGSDYRGDYPTMRRINFGLNLNF
jgi:TonB-linked SusC/RagA family outer membrane protein